MQGETAMEMAHDSHKLREETMAPTNPSIT